MPTQEILQICLNERESEADQLKSELEKLDSEYEKVSFEEDMYYYLCSHRSSQYKEHFEGKRSSSDGRLKELEDSKKVIEEKLKTLNMEIDYIKSKMGIMIS